MEELRLEVAKVNQHAGGGSFVAILDATMTFKDDGISVEVVAVEPPDADANLVGRAADSILRGAQRALEPLGSGATIRIHRLVVHPDFKASAFEHFTFEEVARLAKGKAEKGGGR